MDTAEHTSRGATGDPHPAARQADEPALDAEARAYAEAGRRADAKLGFLAKLAGYVATVVIVRVFAGSVIAGIVALFGGIGLAKEYFSIFLAPKLRERWIAQEVSRRVSRDVRREREVLAAEHTRSLETLSASIAHDIRNPIAAARSLVQQMGEDPHSPENVEYARVALEELGRVERSIGHLLRFARDEPLHAVPMRLTDVLDRSLDALRDRIGQLGVRVERRFDGDGDMVGDPDQLRRVFGNLLTNALDALEEGRTAAPTLTVAAGRNLAGTEVWASIRDNGPGVASEAAPRLFEPFVTSKANGTGLGLAVTRKLVERHAGTIELHSLPGRGAEFVVTLPKAGPAAPAAEGA